MSEFVKVNTADLVGAALDWAVAKSVPQKHWPVIIGKKVMLDTDYAHLPYSPSTDWSQGGPLMDEHRIEIIRCRDEVHAKVAGKTNSAGFGDTALIAACRAIVASVLGETVSVPKELCQ